MGSRLSWNLSNGNPILFLDIFCHKIDGFISLASQNSLGSIEPIEPTAYSNAASAKFFVEFLVTLIYTLLPEEHAI